MTDRLIAFLQAVSATGAWVCGLCFLRFWRASRDALFAFFAGAFWLMALSWVLLALINPTGDGRPYVYAVRLLAFLLILAGMVSKNRGLRN
jgi:hypothetical protein